MPRFFEIMRLNESNWVVYDEIHEKLKIDLEIGRFDQFDFIENTKFLLKFQK